MPKCCYPSQANLSSTWGRSCWAQSCRRRWRRRCTWQLCTREPSQSPNTHSAIPLKKFKSVLGIICVCHCVNDIQVSSISHILKKGNAQISLLRALLFDMRATCAQCSWFINQTRFCYMEGLEGLGLCWHWILCSKIISHAANVKHVLHIAGALCSMSIKARSSREGNLFRRVSH